MPAWALPGIRPSRTCCPALSASGAISGAPGWPTSCATLLATQFLKQLNTVREGLLDTVLGNCENLCAFNVSASDAKILEEELQKKVSQKHIISQPRLHCYARLAIQGEALQIVSVALNAPPSWQRTPALEARVKDIRDQNRGRF